LKDDVVRLSVKNKELLEEKKYLKQVQRTQGKALDQSPQNKESLLKG